MALQRTRRPRIRSGRSLRSLGSPLNARLLGATRMFRISSSRSVSSALLLIAVLTSACSGAIRDDSGVSRSTVSNLMRNTEAMLGKPVILTVFLDSSAGRFGVSDAFVSAGTGLPAVLRTRRARAAAQRLAPDLFLTPRPFLVHLPAMCAVGVLRRAPRGGYRVDVLDLADYVRGQRCFGSLAG